MTIDWEARGRTLGESLSAFHALVVCGMDPESTAEVAIALARVQALRRRVAIGDLFGDVASIRRLIEDDDVHGIVDSFEYGVSLTRIARRSGAFGEFFVMPTGSEAPDYETLLPDPRWGRLAAGFRVTAGLLVLIAPADAPGLVDLVAQMDGAVIVGDHVPTQLPVARVVTILRDDAPAAPAPQAQSAMPAAIRATPPAAAPAVAAPPIRETPTEPQARVRRQPPRMEPLRERVSLSLSGAAGVGQSRRQPSSFSGSPSPTLTGGAQHRRPRLRTRRPVAGSSVRPPTRPRAPSPIRARTRRRHRHRRYSSRTIRKTRLAPTSTPSNW